MFDSYIIIGINCQCRFTKPGATLVTTLSCDNTNIYIYRYVMILQNLTLQCFILFDIKELFVVADEHESIYCWIILSPNLPGLLRMWESGFCGVQSEHDCSNREEKYVSEVSSKSEDSVDISPELLNSLFCFYWKSMDLLALCLKFYSCVWN